MSSNYYSSKKSKKGTGQHAISNAELKALLQKENLLPKEPELCEDEGCPHHGTPHVCNNGD